MKLGISQAVLTAATLGVVLTYFVPPDDHVDQDSANGPAAEPRPIDLRLCAKAIIIQKLIESRLTLIEAASLFGEVDRLLPMDLPNGLDDETVDHPPPTAEERLRRAVANWARSGARSAAVMSRLNAELDEWHRNGPGRLPDPSELVPSPASLLAQAREAWWTQTRGAAAHGNSSARGEQTAAGANKTR